MCGADTLTRSFHLSTVGSPPRVRSRRPPAVADAISSGITSACAEQTTYPPPELRAAKDHLRVCGADHVVPDCITWGMGSPPRVRSRRAVARGNSRCPGITSACAEQTRRHHLTHRQAWDHLRVCGADNTTVTNKAAETGSPPRVRSRRVQHRRARQQDGITSACAEQTRSMPQPCAAKRDHLRVCGADLRSGWRSGGDRGSPPRVRSRLDKVAGFTQRVGITSACAEQTCRPVSVCVKNQDHLRVCGADSCILLCSEPAEWRRIFDLRTA